jgi:hypothetical protein
MRFFYGLSILIACSLAACSYQDYDAYIIGKWNGVKWESEGISRSDNISDYWFHFNESGKYESLFGGLREKGKYRVEYNRLYTHAINAEEIVVEILSMTEDTMRIGMNRGGVAETLVLAHE